MSRLYWAAAGAAACIGSAATAAPLVFTGYDADADSNFANMVNSQVAQSSFLANLVDVGVETLEGLSTGSQNGTTLNFVGNSIQATLNGDADIFSGAFGGRFPTSGEQYLEVFGGGLEFTIDFDAPVAAFGFYGTDFGDFQGQIEVTFSGGNTETYDVGETNAPNGNGLFWGIIDEATFTSVTFAPTNGNDAFAFDDFIVGSLDQVQIIPLPAPVLMAGVGLLGVAAFRRRRLEA